MASGSQSRPLDVSVASTTFHTVEADGVHVFYREAGPANAPVLLLLHGFPSSSHMFRALIPRMATHDRVIAPDLPGFGFPTVPEERDYKYSFDSLAATVQDFAGVLGLQALAPLLTMGSREYSCFQDPAVLCLAMYHEPWYGTVYHSE